MEVSFYFHLTCSQRRLLQFIHRNLLLIFLWTFPVFQSAAQNKSIIIDDLENHSIDSVTNTGYDTIRLFDHTIFYKGSIDTLTEVLGQTPPASNLYPNSLFTRKKGLRPTTIFRNILSEPV